MDPLVIQSIFFLQFWLTLVNYILLWERFINLLTNTIVYCFKIELHLWKKTILFVTPPNHNQVALQQRQMLLLQPEYSNL